MHIKKVKVSGPPPFTQELEIELDERVNLFIGPNGVGKTRLLNNFRFASGVFLSRHPEGMGFFSVSVSEDWANVIESQKGLPDSEWIEHSRAHPPVIDVPATSVGHPGLHHAGLFRSIAPTDIVSGYGTTLMDDRLEGQDVQFSLDEIREEVENLANSNDGLEVSALPEEQYLMKKYSVATKEAANFMRSIEVSYLCAKDICQEMLVGDAPQDYAVFGKGSKTGLPPGRVELGVMIQTADLAPNGEKAKPIHVSSSSTGTELTFWWVRLVALALLKRSKYQFGWEKRPAILLIDEIENHLHPTWQRRVIPALLYRFPGLQIFATTHSPFVVAGLEAGQVHKLYRDASGAIAVETNTERIVGWTVEEILREFMDVSDPTDEETAKSSAILRWLRGQKPTMESAEEWRLEKIGSLRTTENLTADQRIALAWLNQHVALRGDAVQWWEENIDELEDKVSPDLESRGPIAAENERFLQQLEELLQKESESEEEDSP